MTGPRPIAVIAPKDDAHAQLVVEALSNLGHQYQWLTGTAELESNPRSIYIAPANARLGHSGQIRAAAAINPCVVWNRRPPELAASSAVHPEDRRFTHLQLRAFQTAIQAEWGGAQWINDPRNAIAARCKSTQLKHASDEGLLIPKTLISNNPGDIRAFFSETAECIYKPFRGQGWTNEGIERASFTSAVTADDLPPDPLLKAAPGIYQERIRRTKEVRIQVFGKTLLAGQISAIPIDEVDYRISQDHGRDVARIEPPAHIAAGCLAMMARLGLASAAFDFVVDSDGKWVFLEVNESGQFLFLENWCPAIPMLDAFIGFLTSDAPAYVYQERSVQIRLCDLVRSRELGLTGKRFDRETGALSRDSELETA